MVQATSSDTIEKPLDLTGPFPITLANKAKVHYTNGRTLPFTAGDTIVVRTDFYGTPPAVQVAAREIWEISLYAEEQRLRKESALGTVFRCLTGAELKGVLSVKRDDGTLAEYRVTEKTRFCRGDVRVLPSVYQTGMPVAVKPRGLPGGGAMAVIVAESEEALNRAHKDTLTVWRGILERAEVPAFYIILRRDDGARRKIRLPKVFRVTDEADERKPIPGRIYQFGEIIEKPIVVHLVPREQPDAEGTRTAEIISLETGANVARTPPVKPEVKETKAQRR
jgi:hypothetical protein